ncbi:uncharacterized protein LOC106651321 [Trichogramma pretiosum]|uniref:uncharacterized protein LOC106651321 n=1 Tax=Trichogramma pretiosum TaxID=7493 RepID=UPI000C71B7DC|nr:uncharacterized protein LOC106651321 [Trichogramma pretiosum]
MDGDSERQFYNLTINGDRIRYALHKILRLPDIEETWILDYLEDLPSYIDLEEKDVDGNYPMTLACQRHSALVMKALMNAGANPKCQHMDGGSLLHKLSAKKWVENHSDDELKRKIWMLLRAGLRVDQLDDNGMTPLTVAAMTDNPIMAQLLLCYGADVDYIDWELKTPLHYAIESYSFTTACCLISAGADPNIKRDGETCLHMACDLPEVGGDFLVLLGTKGAYLNETDGIDGATPILKAAKHGALEYAQILVALGADVYARDCRGRSMIDLVDEKIDKNFFMFFWGFFHLLRLVATPRNVAEHDLIVKSADEKMVKSKLGVPRLLRPCLDDVVSTLKIAFLFTNLSYYQYLGLTENVIADLYLDWKLDEKILTREHAVMGNPKMRYLVLNAYERGRFRARIRAAAFAAFKKLLRYPELSYSCFYRITNYLFNGDLLNVIAATDIRNRPSDYARQLRMEKEIKEGKEDELKNSQEKLTITKLLAAAKNNQVEVVRNSLKTYGLPRDGPKTTAFSILKLMVQSENRETIIQLLLDAGCPVNDLNTDAQEPTLLYSAVQRQNDKIVEMLLDKGAQIGIKNHYSGLTPMHLAAQKAQYKSLWTMLNHEVDVNITDNTGKTVLQIVCNDAVFDESLTNKVQINVIKKLLEKGALVNITDDSGNTALHSLLSNSSRGYNDEPVLELVKTFFQKGLKWKVDKHGQNFAHIAAGNNHFKTLNYLLDFVEDVNEVDAKSKTILHKLLEGLDNLSKFVPKEAEHVIVRLISMGASFDIKSSSGDAAIHQAIKLKNIDLILEVLQGAGNFNVQDQFGNTVIHHLLQLKNIELEIIDQLLKSNKFNLDLINLKKESVLHSAIKNKHYNILYLLLQRSCNVRIQDFNGDSALHLLMNNKIDDENLVQHLLRKGADNTAKNKMGLTPYHIAGCTYLKELKKSFLMMLKHSNDIFLLQSQCNEYNENILHIILKQILIEKNVDSIYYEIIRLLLYKKVKLDLINCFGKMPVHILVDISNDHLTEFILNNSSKANILSNEGRSVQYFWQKCNSNALKKSPHIMKKLLLLLNQIQCESIVKSENKNDIECYLKILDDSIEENKLILQKKNEEVQALKQIQIGKYANLFDLMVRSSSVMGNYAYNKSLEEIIASENFAEKFPHHFTSIKVAYHDICHRKQLNDKTVTILKNNIDHFLPKEIYEKIVSYLNNVDMDYLITCYRLDRKRPATKC